MYYLPNKDWRSQICKYAYVFCYDWFEANGLSSTIVGNREIDYYTRRTSVKYNKENEIFSH